MFAVMTIIYLVLTVYLTIILAAHAHTVYHTIKERRRNR